jgi:glycosyltransferase involved in cell wall biosynthesis
MVMASTEVRKETESAVPVHSPILSIVVPVYNGSKKIEFTLQKLKDQIENLDSVLVKLEVQGPKQQTSFVYTGRSVIENAGAAMVLDDYLSTHSTEIPYGIETGDDNAGLLSKSGEARIHFGNDSNSLSSPSHWYEIIVVNDGSKDETRAIVDEISSADETIRLISYSTNMGKGYAIKQGVLHSQGKYVIFMDGDGEISTDVLSKYLEQMKSADIVIGSKYHPESVVTVPGSRRFFSKCFHLFVKVMLGIKVSDTQVGLKAGKGDTFRKIFDRVLVKRYAFDAEMLAVAGILGLKVVELPVKIDLDKSFKKKEIVKMAIDVLGIAYRLRVIKWYQKNMERNRPSYRAVMFA